MTGKEVHQMVALAALRQGWKRIGPHKVLYNVDKDGMRIRLNFMRPRSIRFERKIPTTPEDRKTRPRVNMKWDLIQSKRCSDIRKVGSDVLSLFERSQPSTVKTKKQKKQ